MNSQGNPGADGENSDMRSSDATGPAKNDAAGPLLESISGDGVEILGSVGSLTAAYHRLEQGDRDACARIVEYFWHQLVPRIGWVIPQGLRQAYGSEDVVQDVFVSFWKRAEKKEFEIEHREDVFRILAAMVFNKSVKRLKMEQAQKRGGGEVKGDVDLDGVVSGKGRGPRPGLPPKLGPAEEADFRDLCDRIVKILPEDGLLRDVGNAWLCDERTAPAVKHALKLDDLHEKSIERKLKKVRGMWKRELQRIMENENREAS